MDGNQIDCGIGLSKVNSNPKKETTQKILKRVLLWVLIVSAAVLVFIFLKKTTKHYFSTLPVEVVKKPDVFPVRGLHVTSWMASSSSLLNPLIALVNKTELNALVIDLKEADGIVAYDSNLKIVNDLGTREKRIQNLDKVVAELKKNNIYAIARICVFKDPLLANKMPHIAVKDKVTGKVWRDSKGMSWVDPFCKQAWEYNVLLAEEAAQRGFDEIQFDYIRFPSDGKISNCVYSSDSRSDTAQIMAIKNFLSFAHERLKQYNVALSVDVFGLVCSMGKELGVGQVIEEIAPEVDFLCPMVYPSHYYKGMYGLTDPEAQPYKTVYKSINDACKRINDPKKLRPWLQDFSLRVKYSANDVREQMRACYENGVYEWILWNPGCKYTVAALKSKEERKNIIEKKTIVDTETIGDTVTK